MMQGERRNPLVGMIGVWVGGLTLFFTVVNIHLAPWPGHMGMKFYGLPFILDLFGSGSDQQIWGSKHVYSSQDWALLLMSAVGFTAGWWGHRFRPEMSVPDSMDEEEMRLQMEGQAISVSTEGASVNPTTASIVAGIVNEVAEQSEAAISGAIGALSKGEFGEQAAQTARERPKLEAVAVESSPEPTQTQTGITSSVPLPSADEAEVDLDDLLEDSVGGKPPEPESKPTVAQDRIVSGGMDVFSSGSKPGITPEPIVDSPVEVPLSPPPLPSLPEVEQEEDVPELPSMPDLEQEEDMPELPSLPSLPSLPTLED